MTDPASSSPPAGNPPTAAPDAAVLDAIALSRARSLSPILFVTMLAWSIAFEVVLPPGPSGTANNLICSFIVGGVALASRWRRATRWGHALCSILWAAPTFTSLFAQWHHPEPVQSVLVPLEMIAAAVLLDTRWVLGLAVAMQAVWIPLSLRGNMRDATLDILTGLTAQVFGVVMQILIRRALLVHITTANELKRQLAERDQLEDQLLHAQRMEAVGTLAAGLAHDMNNVLGSITSFAGLLEGEVQSARGRADLEQIVAQSQRGAELTRGLLAFSRHGKYRKQTIRIDDIVRGVLPILARTLPRSIAIQDRLGGDMVCIEGDPVRLEQALMNLSLNAAQAMDGQGTLTITTDVVALAGEVAASLRVPPGRYARYQVSDTGIGMDDATRRRVFEPFFTTKPAGKGTGLGLSTVWGIVQSHHGTVGVESTPGKGSTFTFQLPVTAAVAPARIVAPRQPSAPLERAGTVLIADDEPAVLAGTARIIERMGLSAICARNGEEALQHYREHTAAIDLVILDMGMPVMGGAECFVKLREASQVPVLIASGYAADAEVQDVVARGAELIEKPYLSSDLVAIVTRLLRSRIAARPAS